MKIPGSLFLAFGLVGCCSAAEKSNSVHAEPAAHHSLWKIQGKEHAVYLLGSIHLLNKTNYPLPQVMETAYSNSTTIAFEADIAEVENIGNGLKLLKQTTLPEGETIESHVSPELYKLFTNHVAEAGFPLFLVERFKPGMAAMTLEVLEAQKMGLDPEYGIDKHFYHRAKKDAKETIGLETMDFQMSLITGLSKREGELMLKNTLKELESLKTDLGDVVAAWNTGDASKLDKLLTEGGEEVADLNKKMITDRNERWVPQIEGLLKEDKPALVIVGAAHLVGKEGVVEMLRKRKWKVMQL